MIIRETDHEFIMTKQHDHAKLSGDMAAHFKQRYFTKDRYLQEAMLAVYEHDRGWIGLDDTPIWNERIGKPYSFMDYPLQPKLIFYKQGIDEVEAMNPYSALLCSMHYSSFKLFQDTEQEEALKFYQNELSRQKRIKAMLSPLDEYIVTKHLALLQLCDEISLYVALNHAGVSKENENPRYVNGFDYSAMFCSEPDKPLIANWVSNQEIRITPNPFEASFRTRVKIKCVSKELIKQTGIAEAYNRTEYVDQSVVFQAF